MASYERSTKPNLEVTEDALEQTDDQQQFLADILPPLPVLSAVSALHCKEGNKVLIQQLALDKISHGSVTFPSMMWTINIPSPTPLFEEDRGKH